MRDVCDALMTSRPFFTLIYRLNIRCLLPGGRNHERWMRPFNIVVVTCVWPWFDEREFNRSQSDWNELNGGMVRSKKQTECDTVDHWHVRDGGLLSNDWLENKQKNKDFITCGTYVTPEWCHALEMFVYNNILLKSSLDYNQNGLGSNDMLIKHQYFSLMI